MFNPLVLINLDSINFIIYFDFIQFEWKNLNNMNEHKQMELAHTEDESKFHRDSKSAYHLASHNDFHFNVIKLN